MLANVSWHVSQRLANMIKYSFPTITFWKRLDGSELDGSEHFEKNCQILLELPGLLMELLLELLLRFCCMHCIMYLYGDAKRPPVIT